MPYLIYYVITPGGTNEKKNPLGQSTCSMVKVGINFRINYGMGFLVYMRRR